MKNIMTAIKCFIINEAYRFNYSNFLFPGNSRSLEIRNRNLGDIVQKSDEETIFSGTDKK